MKLYIATRAAGEALMNRLIPQVVRGDGCGGHQQRLD
jgi:hypothetical protein